MNLSQYPFIRFTLLLISGFLLAPLLEPQKEFIPWLFLALSLMYLLLNYLWKYVYITQLFTFKKILLALILITGGFIRKMETNPLNSEHHISNQLPENIPGKNDFKYMAYVSSFPTEKNNSCRAELEVEYIFKNNKWIAASGKVFTTFATDTFHKILPGYGDRLLIFGRPKKIISSGNPGQFDASAYFAIHGIFHRQKIYNWTVIGKNYKTNVVYSHSQKCRSFLKKQLTLYVSDTRSCSVASSVLLGDKSQLDNALRQAYSRTGAMHVLAVSGLHVGILFIILQHLTSFLVRLKYGNYIQTSAILLFLLFYAFLTGFSPSVLRSVFMFSLILISKMFQRQTHILNTLFSSAFFLLLYNPLYIYDIGFQLSYSAVISIVLFQKPIYGLFIIKNKIIGFVWNITSVSLAAQVFTLPITLGCFGQYPVYSLLSNLLVIPLSTFILYGGTALFSVSFIPWVAKGVGFILNFLLLIMNNGILWIEKLPFASLEVPMFDYVKVLVLYGIIVSLLLFVKTRILIFFACFVFFSGFIIHKLRKEEVYLKNRRELIVYDARDKFLMEVNKGYESEIYSDAPEYDSIIRNVYLNPSFHNRGVKSFAWNPIPRQSDSSVSFMASGAKVIALVKNGSCLPNPSDYPVKVDFLIIADNKISQNCLKKLTHFIKPDYIVTPGFQNRFLIKWLNNYCASQNIIYCNISQSGTFRYATQE